MNLAETSELLTLIARYDNRRVDDATVIAWHAVLGDLDLADCRTAVIRHVSSSDAYLMPVHIRRLVDEIDRDRRRQTREAREAELNAIEAADPTRRDRSEAVKALIAELRDKLPDGDPDSLRYGSGHWRQVRESRERQANAEPNPHYDPTVLGRLTEEAPDAEASRGTDGAMGRGLVWTRHRHRRYERDGLPTRKDGPEGCLHCPLPASHPVHQLEPTPDDVKAAEARRLGEAG